MIIEDIQSKLLSTAWLSSYSNYQEYLANIVYSQSYYIKLHYIEIAFRNKMNSLLTEEYGNNGLLDQKNLNKIFGSKI